MANTLKFGNGEWYGKKDTILAYNDENSNYKPLPFDFSRASKATVINKDGLIEEVGSGQPRIDFKDDSKGALLLEPSRSNLIPYSEDFSNGVWSKIDSIVSLNQDISPDGTNNATLYTSTSASNRLETNFSHPTSVRTFSIWVKSYNNISVSGRLTFSGLNDLNFTTTNEWQRISTTRDISGDTFKCSLRLTNDNESVLVYGFQLEEGSYATSYIPTSGSAVTRLADTCSQTVPDGVIGQTEGSVYVEVNISNTTSKTILALDTGSASNFIILDTSSSLSPKILVRQSSGSFPAIITGTTMSYGVNKIAFCYKSGDYAMYVNGVLSGTSTSTTFPSGIIKRISVGANSSYGYLSDTVNDVKLYNTRLSNAELQALTQV